MNVERIPIRQMPEPLQPQLIIQRQLAAEHWIHARDIAGEILELHRHLVFLQKRRSEDQEGVEVRFFANFRMEVDGIPVAERTSPAQSFRHATDRQGPRHVSGFNRDHEFWLAQFPIRMIDSGQAECETCDETRFGPVLVDENGDVGQRWVGRLHLADDVLRPSSYAVQVLNEEFSVVHVLRPNGPVHLLRRQVRR